MSRYLLLAPLALAACNSSPTVTAENASIAEVVDKARVASKIEPGKWRTQVTFASVEMPGMPPQIADTVRKQMAQSANKTQETCITKEMAEKPPSEMLGAANDACRYETFKLGGGRLDAVMVCKGEGAPAEMRMTVAGDYGGTSYDLTSDMAMAMPGGAGKMTMKTSVKGERIGDCTGGAG